MKREYSFQKAPRCRATSKRTGQRCKAPAVRGWTVCRFHGAGGGGPKGKRNGNYKHGLHTKEAVEERRLLRELLRRSRKALTVDRIKDQDSTGCFGFRLEKIRFGTAGVEHALIPVLDEDVKQAKAREKGPKGKNQKPVFAALDTAIDTMGQPSPRFTRMPTNAKVTTFDAWERQSLMQPTHDTEKKRQQAFQEAAESLISGGYVGHLNSYVWNKMG